MDPQVVAGQFVSTLTMSAPLEHPTRVLFAGDDFQVCRVHALLDSAEVVDGQASGDGADVEFVGEPMGEDSAAVPVADGAVAAGVECAGPDAAGTGVAGGGEERVSVGAPHGSRSRGLRFTRAALYQLS